MAEFASRRTPIGDNNVSFTGRSPKMEADEKADSKKAASNGKFPKVNRQR